jgi:hypothetical protein
LATTAAGVSPTVAPMATSSSHCQENTYGHMFSKLLSDNKRQNDRAVNQSS